VRAAETGSGVRAEVAVKPSYGLSDVEISRMLTESFQQAGADKDRRALQEARVEAERMLLALRGAINTDGDLLEPEERARLEAAMTELLQLHAGTDQAAIHAAIEALNTLSEDFAARRMDASVRTVLAGHNVHDFEEGQDA
jgi:molecular chaperone HscA